ncbi:fimbrial protein [Pseudomonas sp. R5-89-07]|uniref:fimbrial protein n=1 Tax=Pseudomonas sp. R5-89-07 TaxID=658644 RepID=UPI0021150118|nr:fimbrial protein [Pseudomonas sp. R5-89-07]
MVVLGVCLVNFVIGCLLSCVFFVESALARCSDDNKTFDAAFPSAIVISPNIPIGGVLARSLWMGIGSYSIVCSVGDKVLYEERSGMEMSQIPGVYKTNVEGVGLKFVLKPHTNRAVPFALHYERPLGVDIGVEISLIRTGAFVGKNRLEANFDISVGHGTASRAATYRGRISTQLEENNYTMCLVGDINLDVQLGRFFVGQVRSGSAAPKSFSFDVSCAGVPAGKPLPVKVYFVGDSPSAGTLYLSGRGSSGVAKGVVIGLENDKGVALPFDRANAVPIEWQSSQPSGEVYRFDGLAKYMPGGGSIQPGMANAVMIIVLEYS